MGVKGIDQVAYGQVVMQAQASWEPIAEKNSIYNASLQLNKWDGTITANKAVKSTFVLKNSATIYSNVKSITGSKMAIAA